MKISFLTDAPRHNLALMKLSSYHKGKVDEYIKHLVKSKLTSDITWKGLSDGLDGLPEGADLMDRFARSFVLNPETHWESEFKMNKEVERITNELYKMYGSDTGHLLGLEPKYRDTVRAIVEFTLKNNEEKDNVNR